MRRVFSDEARFARWTTIEVAVVEAWARRGAVPPDELRAVQTRAVAPAPSRVEELERTTHHDVVAYVRALGEIIGSPASRHIHKGLTSSDVVDTALALGLVEAFDVLHAEVTRLRENTAALARQYKATPCVGRTHGVHAEPSSLGLKFLNWHAELGRHLTRLAAARAEVGFGKLSGAIGTFSQIDPGFEAEVLGTLGLGAEPVATQVIPRDRHASAMACLAVLGGGLERIALEIRHGQRTEVRELEEPFAQGQTGSSAMPHKRNPVVSERICGLARLLRAYAHAEFESQALWHERDISHSSVERVALPDAFHLAHYCLLKLGEVLTGLKVSERAARRNLEATRGLVFSQRVLGLLLDAGADRQEAYAVVQRAAAKVWDDDSLHLQEALLTDTAWSAFGINTDRLNEAFTVDDYLKHVDAVFARAGL